MSSILRNCSRNRVNPRFFIARRYLFAKKSHNVINIISIIAAAGIAVGCAALVIILSIYNGFDNLLKSLYESYTPDVVISASEAKVFSPDGDKMEALRGNPAVVSVEEVLQETVFIKYGYKNSIATARGVNDSYSGTTGLEEYLVSGTFDLHYGDVDQMVLGAGLVRELGVNSSFLTSLEVYFPSRTAKVSVLDPTSSLKKVKLFPAGTVSLDQSFDKQFVFMPIEALRSLLEYDAEVSSIEVNVAPEYLTAAGSVTPKLQKELADLFGEGFTVKNKYQQNESLYKMMTYEKLAVYLILIFVVLIISCNIFGSLSMLIIEKKEDIEVLRSMGADTRMINRIFTTEGWMISLLGALVGIVLGVAVCLAQQKLGIVKMPGNFIVTAYPVCIQPLDILIIFVSVAAIGYLMSHCVKAVRIGR